MIFDQEEASFKAQELAALQPRPKPAMETSIDDYLQERRLRLERRDLRPLYDSFQLHIDKHGLQNTNPGVAKDVLRRHRIEKCRDPPRSKADNVMRVRSLNTVPFRGDRGLCKSSLENIEELHSPDSDKELKEVAEADKVPAATSKLLSHFCSVQNIEPQQASLTDVSVEQNRSRPRAKDSGHWDKENISTIKSLESLDGQVYRNNKPRFIPATHCCICRIRFGLRAKLAVTKRCEHMFHEACFKRWVESHCKVFEEKCPKCSVNL